jgi:hypothetical protein
MVFPIKILYATFKGQQDLFFRPLTGLKLARVGLHISPKVLCATLRTSLTLMLIY